jgi:GAF domain-containing protein
MKYRYRIWYVLLLVGVISLVAAGLETNRIVNQVQSLTYDQNRGVVSDSVIQSIRTHFILTYTLFGVILLVGAYFLSGRIASPIEWMATSATQFLRVMQNVWKSLQLPDSQDEMKILSYTFSVLTQQIHDEITNLEKQIEARTADLVNRTAQLETAAQVARESAAILDIDQLLTETTRLISSRFGYYHVGIFLLAETTGGNQSDEYVILQAANSEGGQVMLVRGYKLKVGQGIVGTVAAKREPRIATDVGADAVFFDNPDLPQTRSELALPLRVRTRLIGVLDVQSTKSEAYHDEDIKILQILADQLALAIDNARLIKESQRTLHELEVAYGRETKQAWSHHLAQKSIAFTYDRIDVRPTPIQPDSNPDTLQDPLRQMTVPILIRDQPLGNITLRRDREQSPWNEEDTRLVQDAAAQIASALENARLLEEIRARARQEQLISQITAQFQGSLDMDAVLRAAVRQLGQLPGVSEASIHISPEIVGNQSLIKPLDNPSR